MPKKALKWTIMTAKTDGQPPYIRSCAGERRTHAEAAEDAARLQEAVGNLHQYFVVRTSAVEFFTKGNKYNG